MCFKQVRNFLVALWMRRLFDFNSGVNVVAVNALFAATTEDDDNDNKHT